MKYKKFNESSYTLNIIKTNRFKTCRIEIVFRSNFNVDELTKRSMLLDLLTFSSNKYPTQREMSIALENLYNSSFYSINSKLGNSLISSICFEFINPKYIKNITLKEFLSFPFEAIQNPHIQNDRFDELDFNIIKNRLKAEILSIKDNPKKYAFLQAFKKMCPNQPISYEINGNIESLNKLSVKDLFNFYKYFMNHNYCDIFIVGDLPFKETSSIIKESFNLRSIKNFPIILRTDFLPKSRVKKFASKENYKQSNLVIACQVLKLTKIEELSAFPIFNTIFGGNSLDTKLAKYLRQQNAFCYSTASYYFKYDHILLIHAGINKKNKNIAIKLIKKALKEMQKGDFNEKELKNAKKSITNILKRMEDTQSSIVNNYLFKNIDDLPLYEDRIPLIENVTKNDIIKIANKIKIDTIFMLEGVDDERI